MERAPGNHWLSAAIAVWGALLALWLARVHFEYPVDRLHVNHEQGLYVARLIEFRDLLGAGYLSPQWATHFRHSLGSPYFSYYQPGVFYAASLVPWSIAPVRALGLTVMAFSLVGYGAMFVLVRRRFGTLSGALAASLLLLSVYPATELYVRGDLSEYAGMMLVVVALAALDSWMTTARLRQWALLALASAAIIVTHAPVGLLSHGLLGILLAGLALVSRTRARALAALGALAAGAGLAAFYWLPVLREWRLVSPDDAFHGFYHYTNNFVSPLWLLSRYTQDMLVPLSLGPIVPALVLLNTLIVLSSSRATRGQRIVFAIGLLGLSASVFMMTEASGFVWAAIEPLRRVQFPWRLLSLVTIFSAALAGAMPAWRWERARLGACVAILIGAALLSRDYTAHELEPQLRLLPDVQTLAENYIHPDPSDEWMPKGASVDAIREVGELPQAGPGATVTDFSLSQGRLEARIRTSSASWVRLPHYHFPVGWEATLDGRPVELGADALGLMRVRLPGGSDGTLSVRFTRTPMRTAGLMISGATLVLGLALLARLARRRMQRAPRRAPDE